MLTSAALAIDFIQGMSYADFQQDLKTQYAVIRALQIIGEAAKKIPAPIKAQHPTIPWKAIMGMRDKLTHDYAGINLPIVWETLHQDLPSIRPALTQLLSTLPDSQS